MAADELVEEGGVEHRAGDRADLVEGVGEGDEAVARHPAVGRLHPDRARHGTGLADRAAGVGAERQRRLVRRDGGGAATAGPAGDAGEVPRVVGRAEGAVLGGGAHRELVHVGLAEDRQAVAAEPRDDRGVVRRHPAVEDPRAAGGRQATGGEHVLDRDRDAVQGAPGLARLAPAVGLLGGAQRSLGVDVQEGMDGAVHLGDPVEVGLRQCDARGLTGGERVGQLGRRALLRRGRGRAHCSSPRIRGTRKRCSSTAGAPLGPPPA